MALTLVTNKVYIHITLGYIMCIVFHSFRRIGKVKPILEFESSRLFGQIW